MFVLARRRFFARCRWRLPWTQRGVSGWARRSFRWLSARQLQPLCPRRDWRGTGDTLQGGTGRRHRVAHLSRPGDGAPAKSRPGTLEVARARSGLPLDPVHRRCGKARPCSACCPKSRSTGSSTTLVTVTIASPGPSSVSWPSKKPRTNPWPASCPGNYRTGAWPAPAGPPPARRCSKARPAAS